ncbi:MAG: hypothetical protein V7L14_04375 [Nostoc sp.]|uniref:hypothetical protein n=1 Tax=Nostoc sp. TaxID=1180 RepID=UPI002FF89979
MRLYRLTMRLYRLTMALFQLTMRLHRLTMALFQLTMRLHRLAKINQLSKLCDKIYNWVKLEWHACKAQRLVSPRSQA